MFISISKEQDVNNVQCMLIQFFKTGSHPLFLTQLQTRVKNYFIWFFSKYGF